MASKALFEQIDQDLLDLHLAAHHHGETVRNHRLQLDSMRGVARLRQLHCLIDEPAHVGLLHGIVRPLVGQRLHSANHADGALGGADNAVAVLRHNRGRQRRPLSRHLVQVAGARVNDRQRVLDLMGQIGGQPGQHLDALPAQFALPLQLALQPLAVCDIADHRGDKQASLGLHRAEADLRRELGAVLAPDIQVFNALSHGTGNPGEDKLVPLFRMQGAECLRDKLVDIAAQQFLAGISKHALGGAVCNDDGPPFIDLQNGVRGLLDQLAEAAVGKFAGDPRGCSA